MSVGGCRSPLRSSEPGRDHVDEIIADPFPRGPTLRHWQAAICARMVGWSFKPIRGQVLPTIPVTRSEREENRQKATSHSVAAVLNSKPAADDPSAAFLHHMDWRLERWISKRASDSNPCRPAWDPVAVRYGL